MLGKSYVPLFLSNWSEKPPLQVHNRELSGGSMSQNDRIALPRKKLNYYTPEELYEIFLDQIYSLNRVNGS